MVGSKAWLESEDSQLRALFAELQPKDGEPETWDALAKRLPTHHNGEPNSLFGQANLLRTERCG